MLVGWNGETLPDLSLEREIELASAAGYGGIELFVPKLRPFFERHSVADLARMLEAARVQPLSMNGIENINLRSAEEFEDVKNECRWLAESPARWLPNPSSSCPARCHGHPPGASACGTIGTLGDLADIALKRAEGRIRVPGAGNVLGAHRTEAGTLCRLRKANAGWFSPRSIPRWRLELGSTRGDHTTRVYRTRQDAEAASRSLTTRIASAPGRILPLHQCSRF